MSDINTFKVDHSSKIFFENEHRILLPKPHGNCISHWKEDRQLKPIIDCYPNLINYNYSLEACQEIALKSHGKILLKRNVNATRCSIISGPLQCPDQCDQTLFKTQVTHRPSEGPTIELEIGNPNLEAKRTEELPAMTFEQLIGSLGGLLGLWLGASILTIVEICELVSNLIHYLCTLLTIRLKTRTVVHDINTRV